MAEIENNMQVIEDELRLLGAVNVEVQKLKEASKQVKYRLENLSRHQKKILVDLFVDRIEMFRKKEGKKWKIFADVHFRFNPEKLMGANKKVSTAKSLPDKLNRNSIGKKQSNGATDRD